MSLPPTDNIQHLLPISTHTKAAACLLSTQMGWSITPWRPTMLFPHTRACLRPCNPKLVVIVSVFLYWLSSCSIQLAQLTTLSSRLRNHRDQLWHFPSFPQRHPVVHNPTPRTPVAMLKELLRPCPPRTSCVGTLISTQLESPNYFTKAGSRRSFPLNSNNGVKHVVNYMLIGSGYYGQTTITSS